MQQFIEKAISSKVFPDGVEEYVRKHRHDVAEEYQWKVGVTKQIDRASFAVIKQVNDLRRVCDGLAEAMIQPSSHDPPQGRVQCSPWDPPLSGSPSPPENRFEERLERLEASIDRRLGQVDQTLQHLLLASNGNASPSKPPLVHRVSFSDLSADRLPLASPRRGLQEETLLRV